MFAEAKIYMAFGHGTLSVGAFVVAENLYCITVREIKGQKDIGSEVTNADVINIPEVIMSFTTENQMLNAMAVFTNRTFEEMIDEWNKKLNKAVDTDKSTV